MAEGTRRIVGNDELRFLVKVDKNGPVAKNRPDLGRCWLWLAERDRNGYARFYTKWTKEAPRFAYAHWIGPIPVGMVMDHFACDNGHGGCVNPWHVRPETRGGNVLRGETPSGINSRKTHCIEGHPFSGENLYVTSQGKRQCRACRKRRRREFLERTGR